jgi:uncharacterized protein (TIGR02449 family)
MEELIQKIEARIRSLIQEFQHLSHMNAELKQNKRHLSNEKDKILSKHLSIIAQIEHMVTRLKSIEGLQ